MDAELFGPPPKGQRNFCAMYFVIQMQEYNKHIGLPYVNKFCKVVLILTRF